MPRSNRRRGSRSGDGDDEGYDITRALFGSRLSVSRRDGQWNVQSVSAASASKTYVCPGCSLEIAPRTPHLVAWRADGLMGEAEDLAARRHWHPHCWKIT